MFRSKTIARVVGFVLLVAVVVGCGPAATPAPTTAPQATTPPQPTTPPEQSTPALTVPPEPVTLKLWKYASAMPNQGEFVNEAIQEYMRENPYVTIIYEEFPFATYGEETLPTAFAAGEAPDVFWSTASYTREFYEEGVLLPLEDYLTDEYKADLIPGMLDDMTLGGHIVRIPFETDDVGLCIRTDLWEEMGMTDADIPTTWEQLKDVAARLTTEDHYGIYLAPNPTTHEVWQFASWVWMGGGEFVDKDLTTVYYDSPATVAALQLWKDLMDAGSMVPTALGIGEAIGTGKAVMEFCASSHLGLLKQTYPDADPLVRVIPLPFPDGGAKQERYLVAGGYSLNVSNQSEHPEEAAKFAVWLFASDPARPTKWLTWARPSLPVTKSVAETPEYQQMIAADPRFGQFLAMVDHSRSEVDAPAEIVQAIIDSVQSVLYGGVSAEEAAATGAAQMQAYIDSR